MKIPGLILALSLAIAGSACAQIGSVPGLEVQGPYSSIKRNEDGTREEFKKDPGEQTITKRTMSPQGKPMLSTIYRLNKEGNPLNCDIRDGQGQKLFKSRYGYSKKPGLTFGKLVEEQMFDVRTPRIDPASGKEMPVRRFLYTYNADGSQNRPIAITLTPGKTYEQVYGSSASGLTYDPFKPNAPDAGKAKPDGRVNPNARPINK